VGAPEDQRDWEALARLDPMWAVLSWPERRLSWNRDEFLDTGRREARQVVARLDELGRPEARRAALDFGCGLGRVTRGLADHFDEVIGLDIAEGMVDRARALHREVPNLRFVQSARPDLVVLGERRFDLVYSRLVLQHVGSAAAIRGYVTEFVRVLAEGGLAVFQLPVRLPLRTRLQAARRAYRVLRAAGVSEEMLYRRLRLHPMRMTAVRADDVREWLRAAGARAIAVETQRGKSGLVKATFYAERVEATATVGRGTRRIRGYTPALFGVATAGDDQLTRSIGHRFKLATFAAALILAAGALGCGSDDGDDGSGDSELVEAQQDEVNKAGEITTPIDASDVVKAFPPTVITDGDIEAEDKGTPERAFLEWWQAWQFHDEAAVEALTSKATVEAIGSDELRELSGQTELGAIEVLDATESGNTAAIDAAQLAFAPAKPGGEPPDEPTESKPVGFTMAKEGGEWRFAETEFLELKLASFQGGA
jgi:SAM-dependent methyltransferase